MSLFKKERNKAIVNFIDIDNGSAQLASSGELNGEAGQRIVYDSQAQINSLEQQGYVLEKNDFNPNGETPFFGKQTEYVISFKHQKIAITHPDEKSGITSADLKKVGQQIVHYDGAANRTPQDSVNQVVFRRTVLVDRVTGQKKMQPWQPAEQNFLMVSTPEIPGYIAQHAYVGGESVTPLDCNRNYEVTYEINHAPSSNQQKVEIK